MKVQIKQVIALILMLAGMIVMLSLMPEREMVAQVSSTHIKLGQN